MENTFWLEKWEKNSIGFHQAEVHEFLKEHWSSLQSSGDLPESPLVFVPLCGKSLDMLWLWQQGCRVKGNELSSIPVREFFSENDLTSTIKKQGKGNFIHIRKSRSGGETSGKWRAHN